MSAKYTLKDLCTQTRRDILRMIGAVNSGHPGGHWCHGIHGRPVQQKVMEHTPMPFDPDGREQDLFFLSNGHLSASLYSVLARTGYFPYRNWPFRRLNSACKATPPPKKGFQASVWLPGHWDKVSR